MQRGLLILVIAWLWTSAALAQSEDDLLIHRGVELRKQGQNAEALATFRHANELQPTARAQAQIALALQALGHWVEAEAGLTAVLANELDAWIAHNRAALDTALSTIREHLGTLEIETNVEGATIVVNGTVVGTSPLPGAVRLVAGTAHIEVLTQSYGAMKRDVEVLPHASVKAAIMALPDRGAGQAETPPGTPNQTRAELAPRSGNRATGTTADTKRAAAKPAPLARTAGIIVMVASVPLIAAGVVAHSVRESNAKKYNSPDCFLGNETRDQRCGSNRHAANTAGALAIVGYATGAAALITGVALLFVRDHDSTSDAVQFHVAVDSHSAYVGVRSGF